MAKENLHVIIDRFVQREFRQKIADTRAAIHKRLTELDAEEDKLYESEMEDALKFRIVD